MYFVGPFMYDEFLFEQAGAPIHITQWENVRYATIVNGELVPGALISPPLAVEGGATSAPIRSSPARRPRPSPWLRRSRQRPAGNSALTGAGRTTTHSFQGATLASCGVTGFSVNQPFHLATADCGIDPRPSREAAENGSCSRMHRVPRRSSYCDDPSGAHDFSTAAYFTTSTDRRCQS